MMDATVLTNFERRQMKAEGGNPALQSTQRKKPGVPATMRHEALGDQIDVALELRRALVPRRPHLVGRSQTFGHLPEKYAVRHAIVT